MLQKKMSLTLKEKSKVKGQVDQLMNADYELLKQREGNPNTILQCYIVKRNALIRQYIEEIQQQYSIPSPLKSKQQISSSKTSYKRLDIDLRIPNYSRQSEITKNNNNNKQKLKITSKLNNSLQLKQNSQIKISNDTPKFGMFQQGMNINLDSEVAEISSSEFKQKRINTLKDGNSRITNRIDSKEKPIVTSLSNQRITSASNFGTAKKNSQYSNWQQSSALFFNEKQPQERKTIKKNQKQAQSQGQSSKSQLKKSPNHHNPINEKIQGRIKIQVAKLSKIKQSYRYCVGCEKAILQANIKLHEAQCLSFKELSSLSNEDLYRQLKLKILHLEQSIPITQSKLDTDHAQRLRNRSLNMVKQSKNRRQCSPQSQAFRENYDVAIEIGKKWTYALEQINKLRWFTRIVEKLEKMLAM